MGDWMVDLYGHGDKTASDCVPFFFDSKADAEAYIANAMANGWDWDWVERGEPRKCED